MLMQGENILVRLSTKEFVTLERVANDKNGNARFEGYYYNAKPVWTEGLGVGARVTGLKGTTKGFFTTYREMAEAIKKNAIKSN